LPTAHIDRGTALLQPLFRPRLTYLVLA